MPINAQNPCTCGRTFTHCRKCGSMNVYPVKFRSMEKSMELGYNVTVYGCRGKCGSKTDESMKCAAPLYIEPGSDYVAPVIKAPKVNPKTLDPKAPDYFLLAQDRLNELTETKEIPTDRALAMMRIEGWIIDPEDEEKPDLTQTVNTVIEPPPTEPLTIEQIVDSFTKSKRKL